MKLKCEFGASTGSGLGPVRQRSRSLVSWATLLAFSELGCLIP